MIPCELMVSRVLPVMRRLVATKMAGSMKQKEVAAALGITEAAVSHYLAKKRGNHWNAIEKTVEKSVEKIIGLDLSYPEKVCAVCRDLRRSGAFCAIHLEQNPSFASRGCKTCYSVC